MPVLSNQRHEGVAQAYIADPEKVGWKAYKKVYPKSSQHAAETGFSRLLLKNAELHHALLNYRERPPLTQRLGSEAFCVRSGKYSRPPWPPSNIPRPMGP
jgi:hypothetical protein